MGAQNLGNVVGLIKSETAPAKTYVLWAKILNPAFPDVVDLYIYDSSLLQWIPLKEEGYIKVVKEYAEFSDPSTEKNILIWKLQPGEKLQEVVVKHQGSANGGTITAASMTIGIDGELDKYSVEPLDVFSAPSSTNFIHDTVNTIESWDTVTDIKANLTVEGDNLDSLGAGEFEIYLLIKKIK